MYWILGWNLQKRLPAAGKMSNPAQVVILGEDERHSRLVSAWVRNRIPGFPIRNIRELPMSNGKGSGAQRVLVQYGREFHIHSARQARKWLIVIIDADNFTVQQRLQQLADQLQASEGGHPGNASANGDQIARLVPKWSIETWILFLDGETVDEERSFKTNHRQWDRMLKPAARQILELTKLDRLPSNCLGSLAHGVGELRTLTLKD